MYHPQNKAHLKRQSKKGKRLPKKGRPPQNKNEPKDEEYFKNETYLKNEDGLKLAHEKTPKITLKIAKTSKKDPVQVD